MHEQGQLRSDTLIAKPPLVYRTLPINACAPSIKPHISRKEALMHYIYRASMTVNGRRIYARSYGKRAFRIPVGDEEAESVGEDGRHA